MNRATLIRKNLSRNKLRTGLMLFCTAIAFAIYGVLGGFLDAFQLKGQIDAADRLVVTNRASFTQPLPLSYADRVARVPRVEAVSFVRWTMSYHRDPKDVVPLIFIPADKYLPMFPKLRLGDEARRSFMATRNGLLVGRHRAEALGWKVGASVVLNTFNEVRADGSRSWEFVVSGIYDGESEAEEQGIAGHYAYLNEGLAFGRDQISWLILRSGDPARNDEVAAMVDSQFANSAAETKTQSESAFGRAMLDQLGNVTLIIRLVVGAAFLVILFIVGNTMFYAVRQRTREIGVLKAIGFSARDLVVMIAGEATVVALVGAGTGLLLAGLVLGAIAQPLESVVPGLALSPGILAGGLLMTVLLAAVTGLGPTLMAYRLQVVDALGRR